MRPLDCGAPGVRRIIRDLGPQLAQGRKFKEADSPPTFTDEEFQNVSGRFDQLLATELAKISGPSYGKLAISGEDLKALGVKPGPEMGKLIKELEELVIEDPAMNTKETLLAEATKRLA
jgi:hypothetical protein